MWALWLVARIFASTLATGWLLCFACFALFTQLQAGHLPLFLLWSIIAFLRWFYTLSYNEAAFAYLHNLVASKRQLWVVIGFLELFPWMVAIVFTLLPHAFGG